MSYGGYTYSLAFGYILIHPHFDVFANFFISFGAFSAARRRITPTVSSHQQEHAHAHHHHHQGVTYQWREF
jgi:hypothetical protein